MKFNGHASVVETPYDMGWYDETMARGAFTATLSANPDVQLLINHGEGGSGMPIARTGRNMLLAEDARGLAVDADLDDEDPDVQLLSRKMKNGLIDQMSFAFRCTKQEWNHDYTARRILEADIHRGDVSIVNQGANPATSASVRNLRAAVMAAGGRTTLPGRRSLAEAIGSAVIVEVRSITLAGHRYDLRGVSEVRSDKYTQDQIDEMGKKGHAFGPDQDGHYSYPIADEEDLDNAIRAVGRGAANHDHIRAYIIGRAKAMGLSSKIPDNWNADGSLADDDGSRSFSELARQLADERWRVEFARDRALRDELRSAQHGNFTGTHSHSHPAFGSQGGDKTHTHDHTHDADANHSHHKAS